MNSKDRAMMSIHIAKGSTVVPQSKGIVLDHYRNKNNPERHISILKE